MWTFNNLSIKENVQKWVISLILNSEYLRGSFIQSLAQWYMMHSEPTVVRTLMWHHLGQNSSLFGCLNGEIYNTNHQLIPFPMVSSQILTPRPNSNQSLYFSVSTSLLAWQAGISAFWVPQKERPNIFVYGEKFRAEKWRWRKHMAYILNYGLLGEIVLGGSQTTGGNLFCP